MDLEGAHGEDALVLESSGREERARSAPKSAGRLEVLVIKILMLDLTDIIMIRRFLLHMKSKTSSVVRGCEVLMLL